MAYDLGNCDKVGRTYVDKDEQVQPLGGLRNPFLTISGCTRMLYIGPALLRVLSSYLSSRI
eukprot:2852476-Amphidinium_carterae.1